MPSNSNFDTKEPIIVIIPDTCSNIRIDTAISVIIPEFSRNRIINWINLGHVLINNNPCKPKNKVKTGDVILIESITSDKALINTPQNIVLNIIYEDEDILVINKPAGLTVHPGNGNLNNTLLNGILYHYPESQYIPRAGIVHRLDKDTTGLMVIAKTLIAQVNLVKQLQSRQVSRVYRAIVEGHPHQTGVVNKNIGRDLKNRTKMATIAYGGKEAITNYKVLQYFVCNNLKISYIECRLETGRTHQIRVHMKSIGHSILGDLVYGRPNIKYTDTINEAINNLNRQALHAINLKFYHPVNNNLMSFYAPLAPDIKNLLKALVISDTLKHTNHDNTSNNVAQDISEEETLIDGNWEIIYTKD